MVALIGAVLTHHCAMTVRDALTFLKVAPRTIPWGHRTDDRTLQI